MKFVVGVKAVSAIAGFGLRQILRQRYCDQHRVGILPHRKASVVMESPATKQKQNKAVQI